MKYRFISMLLTIPFFSCASITSGDWEMRIDYVSDGELDLSNAVLEPLTITEANNIFRIDRVQYPNEVSGGVEASAKDGTNSIIKFTRSIEGEMSFFVGSSISDYSYKGSWYSTGGEKGDFTLESSNGQSLKHNSCKDILLSGDSVGDGSYEVEHPDNSSSLFVYCDMTRDGGGWTLISAGEMTEEKDTEIVTPTSHHRYSQTLIDSLGATEIKVGNESSNAMYVKDDAFVLEHDYLGLYGVYGTKNTDLSCTNNYSDFENNVNLKAFSAVKSISCFGPENTSVGSHSCNSNNGWIMFHSIAHLGTYNYGGNHPCPTNSRVENLIWVR